MRQILIEITSSRIEFTNILGKWNEPLCRCGKLFHALKTLSCLSNTKLTCYKKKLLRSDGKKKNWFRHGTHNNVQSRITAQYFTVYAIRKKAFSFKSGCESQTKPHIYAYRLDDFPIPTEKMYNNVVPVRMKSIKGSGSIIIWYLCRMFCAMLFTFWIRYHRSSSGMIIHQSCGYNQDRQNLKAEPQYRSGMLRGVNKRDPDQTLHILARTLYALICLVKYFEIGKKHTHCER